MHRPLSYQNWPLFTNLINIAKNSFYTNKITQWGAQVLDDHTYKNKHNPNIPMIFEQTCSSSLPHRLLMVQDHRSRAKSQNLFRISCLKFRAKFWHPHYVMSKFVALKILALAQSLTAGSSNHSLTEVVAPLHCPWTFAPTDLGKFYIHYSFHST